MARRRWTAPDGWPVPPTGWRPPPGWQPDPAWPSPPSGWRFWQPVPRSWGQRCRLGLLIAIPATLCAALLAAQVADGVAGCGSVDPTDPANYSSIRIVNDTGEPVVIDDCQGGYCQLDQPEVLAAGEQITDHAACGATGSDMTSWRVRRRDGQLAGYIAVDSPKSQNQLIFRVSHASADRAMATPEG